MQSQKSYKIQKLSITKLYVLITLFFNKLLFIDINYPFASLFALQHWYETEDVIQVDNLYNHFYMKRKIIEKKSSKFLNINLQWSM